MTQKQKGEIKMKNQPQYEIREWTFFETTETEDGFNTRFVSLDEIKDLPALKTMLESYVLDEKNEDLTPHSYEQSVLFSHKSGCLTALKDLLQINVYYHTVDFPPSEEVGDEHIHEYLAIQYADGDIRCYELKGNQLWYGFDGLCSGEINLSVISSDLFPIPFNTPLPIPKGKVELLKQYVKQRLAYSRRKAEHYRYAAKIEYQLLGNQANGEVAILETLEQQLPHLTDVNLPFFLADFKRGVEGCVAQHEDPTASFFPSTGSGVQTILTWLMTCFN